MGIACRFFGAMFKGPDKLMNFLIIACLLIIIFFICGFKVLTGLWGVGFCAVIASYFLIRGPLYSFGYMVGFYGSLIFLSALNVMIWFKSLTSTQEEFILTLLFAFSIILLLFLSVCLHNSRYNEVKKDIGNISIEVNSSI